MGVKRFIWDELSDNVILETDENDVVTASYTHQPNQFGELLSQERNGVTSYYHYDGRHSTRDLTDASEDVTDTFIYTAYGEEVARTGTTTNPFGYKGAVGYYTNEETSDIYVRTRTYQPTIGRWLSMDPLGFIDGTNLYRAYFVPRMVDPRGMYQVTMQTDAFIQQDWIPVDPWSWVKGNNREISQTPLGVNFCKALSKATVEAEKCVQDDPMVGIPFSDISESVMKTFADNEDGYRILRKKGNFTATVTATRTGPCSVQVKMTMDATIPFVFVPLAPSINWDVTYNVHVFEFEGVGVAIDYELSGLHDGFPAYEFYVQNELIHSHDSKGKNQTIFSLIPPMEFEASAMGRLWNPGAASCCECKGSQDDLFKSLYEWGWGLLGR